jgi:hypothetical protein
VGGLLFGCPGKLACSVGDVPPAASSASTPSDAPRVPPQLSAGLSSEFARKASEEKGASQQDADSNIAAKYYVQQILGMDEHSIKDAWNKVRALVLPFCNPDAPDTVFCYIPNIAFCHVCRCPTAQALQVLLLNAMQDCSTCLGEYGA